MSIKTTALKYTNGTQCHTHHSCKLLRFYSGSPCMLHTFLHHWWPWEYNWNANPLHGYCARILWRKNDAFHNYPLAWMIDDVEKDHGLETIQQMLWRNSTEKVFDLLRKLFAYWFTWTIDMGTGYTTLFLLGYWDAHDHFTYLERNHSRVSNSYYEVLYLTSENFTAPPVEPSEHTILAGTKQSQLSSQTTPKRCAEQPCLQSKPFSSGFLGMLQLYKPLFLFKEPFLCFPF